METDQELLELAAKAAGKSLDGYGWCVRGNDPDDDYWGFFKVVDFKAQFWNPLADDGDALRLAVVLGLSVRAYPIYDEPKHSVLVQKSARIVDDQCVDIAVATCAYDDSDPYAATRRAIVHAAAEIGRAMK